MQGRADDKLRAERAIASGPPFRLPVSVKGPPHMEKLFKQTLFGFRYIIDAHRMYTSCFLTLLSQVPTFTKEVLLVHHRSNSLLRLVRIAMWVCRTNVPPS
jgi:hypothetical protein